MRTLLILAATAGLLAACGDKADDTAAAGGPVVAAPQGPANEAVDTTPTTGDAAQTAGANSYTEAQAKSAIESAGYTGVSALKQDTAGLWQGMATKDGRELAVSVDFKGSVTAMTPTPPNAPAAAR